MSGQSTGQFTGQPVTMKSLLLLSLLALAAAAPNAFTVVTRGTNPPSTTTGRLTRAPPTEKTSTTKVVPISTTAPSTPSPSTKDPTTTKASTMAPTTTTQYTTKGPSTTQGPLVKVLDAAEKAGASLFADLARNSLLGETLAGEGPFTVFAPSDEAVALFDPQELLRIASDPLRLQQLVGYHATNGLLVPSTNDQLEITLAGPKIRFNFYNINNTQVLSATGAPVSKVSLPASNGIVHILDRIMYPTPVANLVETLAFTGGFGRLAGLIQLTDLADILGQDAGSFTMFAPTDKAIEKIKEKDLRRIIENADLLEELLKLHTVNGTIHDVALVDEAEFTSLTNQTIAITELISGAKLVSGAPIDPKKQISVTNGVIHGIDTFMFVPSYMRESKPAH